ncbi:deoxyribodipyrimidine photo-lyase [Nocardiopsis sp. NPDC006139]|uniref:cryptochrome/photolyase family protein n=1 Tax=unclassified Nocardiopsis TaxID=2649073 RepID=UPI0015979BF4|nr:deoxyribodipyrimidine photo-lyase [Nocardiopsis flavescens]
MEHAVVLFTQDLRLHDHPALTAALRDGRRVLPVFVLDPVLLGRSARNRVRALPGILRGLRGDLRARGGDLVVRRGDTAAEVAALAAEAGARTVHLTEGVSRAAAQREERLRAAGLHVVSHPGLTVVPPGDVTPAGGDHYKVFTPYLRAWEAHPWRAVLPAPGAVPVPGGVDPGEIPARLDEGRGEAAERPITLGEEAARRRLRAWLDGGLAHYAQRHDDLPAGATSHLSADLRMGCLSALEAATLARDEPGGAEFVRQLAWRDFHHQVTAAFPDIAVRDYRPRGTRWRDDPAALEAWKEGRTGVPIVDAGMRQLLSEGFMHNRTRMITAAFLTRTLGIHWRAGAGHFADHLLDGDVANNHGNWQWVAGTGNDTRPNRAFNPLRQARRFDPEGVYVRRYVPELAGLPGRAAHTPWDSPRPGADYPPPIASPGS